MSNSVIEKQWVTNSGLDACVLIVHGSHRCGYVKVPSDSHLHGKEYTDLGGVIDVHGGITFADDGDGFLPTKGWWFGFDCAHHGDGFLPDSEMAKFSISTDEPKSLDFCIAECESMAKQLQKVIDS